MCEFTLDLQGSAVSFSQIVLKYSSSCTALEASSVTISRITSSEKFSYECIYIYIEQEIVKTLKFSVNNALFQRGHCNNMRNKRQDPRCAHGKARIMRGAGIVRELQRCRRTRWPWILPFRRGRWGRTAGIGAEREKETRSGTMSSLRVLKRESVRRNARNRTRQSCHVVGIKLMSLQQLAKRARYCPSGSSNIKCRRFF